MSRVNPYASIEKRRFENALVYMLQKEYGFMQGGRRILQLLSEDVMGLIEEFWLFRISRDLRKKSATNCTN